LKDVPEELRKKFPWTTIEDGEADYLIVSKESKKGIIID